MPTEQAFLKDVQNHVIEIFRDDGVNRHIRFRKPGTMCMHFDLITWPGYLCYTGDMGTYVFQRLEDMFEFFRRGNKDKLFQIDFRYWAEKLQAVDSSCGKGSATEFSKERFTAVINDYRLRWIRDAKADGCLNKAFRRELWQAVEDEVLSGYDDDEHEMYRRANEFSWQPLPHHPTYSFNDLWDHRFTEYTHHFTWCCYALAWSINKYDEGKP